MHVAVSSSLDLNWFLQLIFTLFVIVFALLYLLKNTASKYFKGGDAADRTATSMPGLLMDDAVCIVCANPGPKKCSRCKEVRYCSQKCQTKHWQSGHKTKCKLHSVQPVATNNVLKLSGLGAKKGSSIALVPGGGSSRHIKKPKEVLFPYEEFVEYFNWNTTGCTPCGLLNCGNSCFANVVLQCLTHTRPLAAYLLEKSHQRECKRNDWCFLCEFQIHVERANCSLQPFSPVNILSRLPNIGGNMGYGRQEDAHEFMRFAIDTMQSDCLDEFGGEKAVPPSYQETTLIQHIFGGRLQSQVTCTRCDKISNQYENMMDLTVEIHGDVATLEECLDQFTVKEWLHGENMYKCDGCNDYVKAWKRLTVLWAPNILTIALKRFQSGRFGKLNKRVTFPETLDLSPYMSEAGDGTDIYNLYAVVVHVDMLNASYFGHYICYTKGFCGNWYMIDDCKVTKVELDDVLSQGAYMLLYNRVCARSSCLKTSESAKQQPILRVEGADSTKEVECFTSLASLNGSRSSFGSLSSDNGEHSKLASCGKEVSVTVNSEEARQPIGDAGAVNSELGTSVPDEVSSTRKGSSVEVSNGTVTENGSNIMNSQEIMFGAFSSQALSDTKAEPMSNGVSGCNENLPEAEYMDIAIPESYVIIQDHANGFESRTELDHKGLDGLASSNIPSAETQKMNGYCDDFEGGNMAKKVELANGIH